MSQDELITTVLIKLKNKGAVYIKLQSSPTEVSVVTIKANLQYAKIKQEKTSAGEEGLIKYNLLDSKTA